MYGAESVAAWGPRSVSLWSSASRPPGAAGPNITGWV